MARSMNSTTEWQRSSNLGWHHKLKVPEEFKTNISGEENTLKQENTPICSSQMYTFFLKLYLYLCIYKTLLSKATYLKRFRLYFYYQYVYN